MKLLLDVGNSRWKWMLATDGEAGIAGVGEPLAFYEMENAITAQWGSLTQVQSMLVSSVAADAINQQITAWAHTALKLDPQFARVQKCHGGVTVGYGELKNLGVDRWLAMLAAWSKVGGECVVVDAGSAITVDYLDADGLHQGGLIVPGVSLMRSALFQNTAAVKIESLTLPPEWHPGCDTLPCVANGLSAMLKGFMSEVLTAASGDAELLITGGDAEVVSAVSAAPAGLHPHLVLEGLMRL